MGKPDYGLGLQQALSGAPRQVRSLEGWGARGEGSGGAHDGLSGPWQYDRSFPPITLAGVLGASPDAIARVDLKGASACWGWLVTAITEEADDSQIWAILQGGHPGAAGGHVGMGPFRVSTGVTLWWPFPFASLLLVQADAAGVKDNTVRLVARAPRQLAMGQVFGRYVYRRDQVQIPPNTTNDFFPYVAGLPGGGIPYGATDYRIMLNAVTAGVGAVKLEVTESNAHELFGKWAITDLAGADQGLVTPYNWRPVPPSPTARVSVNNPAGSPTDVRVTVQWRFDTMGGV